MALVWRVKRERRRDEGIHVVEGPRSGRAQEGFEFRERLFNRIEVGAVRRQEPQQGSGRFDSGADVGVFVHGEIVEDDDIARTQCGREHLLDVGEETESVDRSGEHGRRGQTIEPESHDEGVGLPVTTRGMVPQADAAGTPPVAAQQVGGDAAFIQEHIPVNLPQRLPGAPLATRRHHVRAPLFVSVYGFF